MEKKTWIDYWRACQQITGYPQGFDEQTYPLEPIADDEDEFEVCECMFLDQMEISEAMLLLKRMEWDGTCRMLTGPRRAMEYIAEHTEAQKDRDIILPIPAMWKGRDDSWRRWYVPIFTGMYFGKEGNQVYLSDVDCRVAYDTPYAPGSFLVLREKNEDKRVRILRGIRAFFL